MIGTTGENLHILLHCSHVLHHDWMSFLCWYSFQQNLPDAKFSIFCSRKNIKYDLFNWTKRVGVNFEIVKYEDPLVCLDYAYKKSISSFPVFVIKPNIVCIKEFNGVDHFFNNKKNFKKDNIYFLGVPSLDFEENNLLFLNIKETKFCNFVCYSEGWGNFRTDLWINKMGNPLNVYSKHDQGMLSTNERKFAKVWRDACNIFHSIC